MAQKILIKKSTVAAKAPTEAQLDVGELAVNTADSLLYTKHSDGSIKRLSPTMTERFKIADSVSSSDARLTDSREWSEATISQAEAEGGIASTRRAWTSQRVRQAINAWWQLVTSGFGRNLVSATNEAAARNILQLTGAWVDLRPYLKPGFFFDPVRTGRNSHPRIRKLSCGRVELDGAISFNATSGPVPIDVFVNVPAEFRPPLTVGGLMFGDTESPLSFGACNWLVTGQVEYSPPRVHGDIMMIPLTLTSPAQNGTISINGIYWYMN